MEALGWMHGHLLVAASKAFGRVEPGIGVGTVVDKAATAALHCMDGQDGRWCTAMEPDQPIKFAPERTNTTELATNFTRFRDRNERNLPD